MILTKPFDNGGRVEFEVSTGTAAPVPDMTEKPQGDFASVSSSNVAIYCENNKLFLQVDKQRWDLASGDLVLKYYHYLAKKTTRFEVHAADKDVVIEYKSWWSDIPGFEPVEPEMDEDEDFLGYVYAVWKNQKLQKSLVKQWG